MSLPIFLAVAILPAYACASRACAIFAIANDFKVNSNDMCLHPVMAWRNAVPNPSGKYGVHFKPSINDSMRLPFGDYQLPCGKCNGCLKDKINRWSTRLRCEFLSNQRSSFITLTYAPKYLPPSNMPVKKHIQDFIKRFRHYTRDFGFIPPSPQLKYFIVSEHGTQRGRVHYHGLLFGLDILHEWDSFLHHFNEKGFPVFTSESLAKIWSFGFVSVDTVSSSSISYVANYLSPDSLDIKLFSQHIGTSLFCKIDTNERNRRVVSGLKDSAIPLVKQGFIDLPLSRSKNTSRHSLPKFVDRYLERFNPSLYDSVKSLRRYVASNSPYGNARDYGDYLLLTTQRANNERLLHYEETLRNQG